MNLLSLPSRSCRRESRLWGGSGSLFVTFHSPFWGSGVSGRKGWRYSPECAWKGCSANLRFTEFSEVRVQSGRGFCTPAVVSRSSTSGRLALHHRQVVGDVLVEAGARYLEVHGVFARRQGRQRRPKPRRYQLVRTRVEQPPLGYLGGE